MVMVMVSDACAKKMLLSHIYITICTLAQLKLGKTQGQQLDTISTYLVVFACQGTKKPCNTLMFSDKMLGTEQLVAAASCRWSWTYSMFWPSSRRFWEPSATFSYFFAGHIAWPGQTERSESWGSTVLLFIVSLCCFCSTARECVQDLFPGACLCPPWPQNKKTEGALAALVTGICHDSCHSACEHFPTPVACCTFSLFCTSCQRFIFDFSMP
jgi:hypothetical protein